MTGTLTARPVLRTCRTVGPWGRLLALGGLGPRYGRLSLPCCSIHNGVIAVFQRKGLPDQELFSLNEGVR